MTVGQFPSYTYTKLGVFYYSRRVPRDLLHHYITGKVVIFTHRFCHQGFLCVLVGNI